MSDLTTPDAVPEPSSAVISDAVGEAISDAISSDHRCGFIAIVGRPNAGKSTLMNQVLGQKLAIISAKPQTTRNRIMGVHTTADMQAVMLDTPGLHSAKSRINKAMVDTARSAISEVDTTCWVIDAAAALERLKSRRPVFHKGHRIIRDMIAEQCRGPLVVVLNKVDGLRRDSVLPLISVFAQELPDATFVPISARTGAGVDRLMTVWKDSLPPGPRLFPEDVVTDRPERFIVSEMIREKLFRMTRQEIPYATAVEIDQFEEEAAHNGSGERGLVRVHARIFVERDGQKAVVIGKGGEMLKRVGTTARADIEALLDCRCHLELHVSVKRDWTENPRILHELGIE